MERAQRADGTHTRRAPGRLRSRLPRDARHHAQGTAPCPSCCLAPLSRASHARFGTRALRLGTAGERLHQDSYRPAAKCEILRTWRIPTNEGESSDLLTIHPHIHQTCTVPLTVRSALLMTRDEPAEGGNDAGGADAHHPQQSDSGSGRVLAEDAQVLGTFGPSQERAGSVRVVCSEVTLGVRCTFSCADRAKGARGAWRRRQHTGTAAHPLLLGHGPRHQVAHCAPRERAHHILILLLSPHSFFLSSWKCWSAFRSLTLISRQQLESSQRRWRRDRHRLHQQSDPR